MNKRPHSRVGSGEPGQALVIMVFVVVGLLVAAGLAIDGGAAVVDRRRMQNAADAAALAGTRELAAAMCHNGSAEATDAAVYGQMLAYAQSNGVQEPGAIQGYYVRFVGNDVREFDPPVPVGGGAVPQYAAGIKTTTAVTQATHFLGLVGQSTAGAGATATAVAGPPLVTGGIRPFGVSVEAIDGLGAGDCFYEDFKNCSENAPENCLIRDESGDVIGQHRNWLDLDYVWNKDDAPGFPRAVDPDGNADALMEWMRNGWPGQLYSDCLWSDGCRWGDYIHAKPGTTSSAVCEAPTETPFVIPIFDVTPFYNGIPAPKPPGANQGDYYYHIVGFATIHIPASDGCNQGAGWLKACIEQVIMGEGQPAPNLGFQSGDDICLGHTMVVSLWH